MILAEAKYAEFPPEFAVYCGWLVFALVVLVCALAWLRSESVRRYLFALEDPRTMAVLRIGFAIMTLVCFLNLEPYWRMLLSDEGVFDLEYAQEKLGRQALRGWTPEEGFFDGWAVLNFLWNKPSLFYFWGSPDFVVGYMLAFFAVLLLYAAGVFSRTTGLLAWLLMSGIYNRNALYLEGTDTVYRCFWFILLFAKTGHAWSFDNWWRCRRLRKQGRLADPDAEPQEDQGDLEPVYRKVPAWPRYLFMLQLAALYCSTGSVKTGSVWAAGDALYYALNMDHFYRFEWVTQQVSYLFGTNLFRVNTWVTHWWERLFPLVLIGVSLRFTLRNRNEPWYQAQDRPWRRWSARAVAVAIWALAWRINYLVLPFCLEMEGDKVQDPTPALLKINIAWGVVIPAFVVAWYVLGRWPITLLRERREIPWLTKRVPWLAVPALRIDQESLRACLLGRRVWLTLGFVFHGFLILFMNIGMFPFIMLMTYAGFLEGEESNRIVQGMVRLWARIPGLRRLVPQGHARWFAPARVNPIEDDAVTLRGVLPWLLAALLCAAVAWAVPSFVFDARLIGERSVELLVFSVLVLAIAAALDLRGHHGRLLRLPSSTFAALYCGYQASAYMGTVGRLAGLAVAVALLVELRRRKLLFVPVPRREGRRLPDLLVLAFGLMGAALIWLRVDPPEWAHDLFVDLGDTAWDFIGLIALTAVAFQLLPARPTTERDPGHRAPLAYGTVGRALVVLAVVYHSAAVGLSLLPSYPILNKWRSPAAAIFSSWLRGTATSQSWRMFAPNPPRSNTFMKTVVVDADGTAWDLRNNAFHYRPNPWIWNDRMRKMQRRMVGKGKWYLRYWSTWQCREWALETGQVPYEVKVYSIVTKIPPPDAVAEKGPYHPRKLKPTERHVESHKCGPEGELPLYVKERYGLPITDEDRAKAERDEERYLRKFQNRRTTWDNRRDFGNWAQAEEAERERRERAEEARRKRDADKADPSRRRLMDQARGVTPVQDDDELGPGVDDEGAQDPKE